jgi:endo-1,3-1,4-beta-glycanase ExoK
MRHRLLRSRLPVTSRARVWLWWALMSSSTGCSSDGSTPRQRQNAQPVPGSPTVTGAPELAAENTGGAAAGEPPTTPNALASEGGNPVGESAPDDVAGFELWWEDSFETFDASRWQLMTHSWDSNLAQFSPDNARIDAGILSLALTAETSDSLKPFRGVEMRSVDTLTYGKVEARVRFARGSGVVSSLVTIYTPWPADDWNELDIEYLGRYSDRVQFNAMVYTGARTTGVVQQSVTPTQFPLISPLGFDPSADFHVYTMEWTPAAARFAVDGVTQHVWDTEIERLKLPMNILLTIWASSAASWAGPLDETGIPATAEYDWIRVYRLNPAVP